jgi:hypothetical protein
MVQVERQQAYSLPRNVSPHPLFPLLPAADDGQNGPHLEDIQSATHGEPQRPPYLHRPHYNYGHYEPPGHPLTTTPLQYPRDPQHGPYGPRLNMDIPLPVEHVDIPDQAQHTHYYAPLPQVVSLTWVYEMVLFTDNTSYVQRPAIPNGLGFDAYARPVHGVQPQARLYDPQGPQLGAYYVRRLVCTFIQAVPNQWPYQILPDARQAENLRRLAIHYLQNMESQVDTVRMEQSLTGRFKVVIVLDMDDFL